jgi:hypothetical protein
MTSTTYSRLARRGTVTYGVIVVAFDLSQDSLHRVRDKAEENREYRVE